MKLIYFDYFWYISMQNGVMVSFQNLELSCKKIDMKSVDSPISRSYTYKLRIHPRFSICLK